MPFVWTFFFIRNAQYTIPPKDKYVLVVCQDTECHAFFVNSKISRFIQNRPNMLACQVLLKASEYDFLQHDSYLNCSQLYAFDEMCFTYGRGTVLVHTKKEIKNAVAIATTIDQKYQEMIALM